MTSKVTKSISNQPTDRGRETGSVQEVLRRAMLTFHWPELRSQKIKHGWVNNTFTPSATHMDWNIVWVMQAGRELLRKGNRFAECLGVFISATSCHAGSIIREWGKSCLSSLKGTPSWFLKMSSPLSHVCFRHVFAFHAILASGTDTIVFCWRQTILCLVVYENLVIFFLYFMGQEFGQGSVGRFFCSTWWQLGSVSGFQLADGLGWGGGSRTLLLPCLVPWWGVAGRQSSAGTFFSPWSPSLTMWSVQQGNQASFTVAQNSERECSKIPGEKFWGIWRANLRSPWVSLLPHSVVRQVTGPVQSQEEGKDLSSQWRPASTGHRCFSTTWLFTWGLGIWEPLFFYERL